MGLMKSQTYYPLGEETEQKCNQNSFPVLTGEESRPFGFLSTVINLNGLCDLHHLEVDERMLFFSTGVHFREDGPGFVMSTVGDKPSRRFRQIPPLKQIQQSASASTLARTKTYKDELQKRQAALQD